MTKKVLQKLEERSIALAERFYQGEREGIEEMLHPNIVFLAVGKGQLIKGLDTIKEALERDQDRGKEYELLTISGETDAFAENVCQSVLQMDVIVHYPDNVVAKANQRLCVLWVKEEEWLIASVHASLAMETQTSMATLIPHISEQLFREAAGLVQTEEKLGYSDVNGQTHYLLPSQIVRVEAAKRYSKIYTLDGRVFKIHKSMKDYEMELNDHFVRIHNSHIVNSTYVEKTVNYKVTMNDGVQLPVSRSKYAEIKKKLGKVADTKYRQAKRKSQK